MTNPDQPVFVQPVDRLIPVSAHLGGLAPIPPSRMFLIRKSLAEYKAKHPDSETFDASQGDGGASLPGVPSEILEAAARKQVEHGSGYDMPYGTDAFRRAVVEDYWGLNAGSGLGPQNVIGTVGGRDGLIKAYEAMLALGHGREGDLMLVSRVPWISYNWGPYGVGANVLLAPGRPEDGWAYSEGGIRESVAFAARHGRKIAGLVITNPDNPTGRTIPAVDQVRLARCALEAGAAFVLFDWIYHYVTDAAPIDLNDFVDLFSREELERVIFLDGITKSLGGSNIRNAHLITSRKVADFIVARASHAVMPAYFGLAVAQSAYEMGYREATRGIVEPTNASRILLRAFLSENGYRYILGQGYYAFIDVGDALAAAGWPDTEPLGEYLAREHGLAVVPGAYSSEDGAGWIRFSYAMLPEHTRRAAERLHVGLQALLSNKMDCHREAGEAGRRDLVGTQDA
jgi:aspartate/methionine/tyrosine aminotransferase